MSKQLVLRLYEPRSENIIPAYCKYFTFEIYKFISPNHHYELIRPSFEVAWKDVNVSFWKVKIIWGRWTPRI